MLAEATTTELTKVQNPEGLEENRRFSQQGGQIDGNARKEIEEETGRPVTTNQNAKQLNGVVIDLIEGVSEIAKKLRFVGMNK